MTNSSENLIWLDLEMTGLNIDNNRIIEIATVVTDKNLNIIAEGPVFAIWQPESILAQMDDWNTKQHTSSGLIERVKASQVNEIIAEQATLEFLAKYSTLGTAPLCGNSVWQDRRFLERYMPNLERYFHYRMLDVSTLKELSRRWMPKIYSGIQKKSTHLALEDIKESISELAYYRDNFLRNDCNDGT